MTQLHQIIYLVEIVLLVTYNIIRYIFLNNVEASTRKYIVQLHV